LVTGSEGDTLDILGGRRRWDVGLQNQSRAQKWRCEFLFISILITSGIRILTQRIRHGARKEVERDVGDYEKIGACSFHFRSKRGAKAIRTNKKPSLKKRKPNVPVDDADLHFPASVSK